MVVDPVYDVHLDLAVHPDAKQEYEDGMAFFADTMVAAGHGIAYGSFPEGGCFTVTRSGNPHLTLMVHISYMQGEVEAELVAGAVVRHFRQMEQDVQEAIQRGD
jgi:hypothetical protein